LTEADKQSFYFLKARAYSDLGDFNQDQTYRPAYYAKSLAYADTALQYCRPGSYECLSVREFRAQKTGNLAAGPRCTTRFAGYPTSPCTSWR
jgi:hypothetical protein